MTNAKEGKGRCLCGSVQFKAANVNHHIGACHCSMCRHWGGGPLMAADCGSDVKFEGDENISVFNSSAWAERGFCKSCGSHLFYRIKQTQQHMIPVGLFDEADSFVFERQVFIDKKPSYYDFSNKTETMTEAEVFAKYAAPT